MKNGLGYSALVAVALLLALGLVADTSEAFAIAPSRIHRQASNTATASTATKLYASNNSKSIGIQTTTCTKKTDDWSCRMTQICSSALLAATLLLSTCTIPTAAFAAEDLSAGATSSANAKITTGGASTLQSGRTIAITRGVNLDRSDFSNQNLKGVAFQQSIVRDVNFKNCNLVSSSFFDATVDGSNFENADLTQANFEMAQFKRASLKVRTGGVTVAVANECFRYSLYLLVATDSYRLNEIYFSPSSFICIECDSP